MKNENTITTTTVKTLKVSVIDVLAFILAIALIIIACVVIPSSASIADNPITFGTTKAFIALATSVTLYIIWCLHQNNRKVSLLPTYTLENGQRIWHIDENFRLLIKEPPFIVLTPAEILIVLVGMLTDIPIFYSYISYLPDNNDSPAATLVFTLIFTLSFGIAPVIFITTLTRWLSGYRNNKNMLLMLIAVVPTLLGITLNFLFRSSIFSEAVFPAVKTTQKYYPNEKVNQIATLFHYTNYASIYSHIFLLAPIIVMLIVAMITLAVKKDPLLLQQKRLEKTIAYLQNVENQNKSLKEQIDKAPDFLEEAKQADERFLQNLLKQIANRGKTLIDYKDEVMARLFQDSEMTTLPHTKPTGGILDTYPSLETETNNEN